MRRGEVLLLGGAVLGGLYLLGRSARASPPALPPPRPVIPIPRPTPLPEPERSRLDELLDEYFSADALPGHFYQVVPTDTLDDIARRALATVGTATPSMVIDYVHCISSGPYNLSKYGTPSTSKSFPQRYLVPGLGLGLRAAFLPRNADALALIAAGLVPPRTVDAKTAKGTTDDIAYGLIWLPPVSPEDLDDGTVTCAPFSYADGSSTIDPDPELLHLLEAA